MNTTQKSRGSQIGWAHRSVVEYEQAIEALSDEAYIQQMEIERFKRIASFPVFDHFRSVSIGVLLENLRRARLRLTSGANEWGYYIGIDQ